jgi:hypothetical protein
MLRDRICHEGGQESRGYHKHRRNKAVVKLHGVVVFAR